MTKTRPRPDAGSGSPRSSRSSVGTQGDPTDDESRVGAGPHSVPRLELGRADRRMARHAPPLRGRPGADRNVMATKRRTDGPLGDVWPSRSPDGTPAIRRTTTQRSRPGGGAAAATRAGRRRAAPPRASAHPASGRDGPRSEPGQDPFSASASGCGGFGPRPGRCSPTDSSPRPG
jgi:hypothetical protein